MTKNNQKLEICGIDFERDELGMLRFSQHVRFSIEGIEVIADAAKAVSEVVIIDGKPKRIPITISKFIRMAAEEVALETLRARSLCPNRYRDASSRAR